MKYHTKMHHDKVSHGHDIIRKNGVVYTPEVFAGYVAAKLMSYYFDTCITRRKFVYDSIDLAKLQNIRIIDPACGEGQLLVAAWKAFSVQLLDRMGNKQNFHLPNPNDILCGIDIDNKSISLTKKRIAALSNSHANKNHFNLTKTNALFPFNRKSSKKGWIDIGCKFNAHDGFDLLIANPPWGADTEAIKKL